MLLVLVVIVVVAISVVMIEKVQKEMLDKIFSSQIKRNYYT